MQVRILPWQLEPFTKKVIPQSGEGGEMRTAVEVILLSILAIITAITALAIKIAIHLEHPR